MKEGLKTEMIEAYVSGDLSGAEKAQLEAEIARDPLLQNEVALQKDIINSIKSYRKAQLKSRLDQISVGPTGTGITAVKVAAGLLIAAVAGTGIYFYADSEKAAEKAPEERVVTISEKQETANASEAPAEVSESNAEENTQSPINPSAPENPAPERPVINTSPEKTQPEAGQQQMLTSAEAEREEDFISPSPALPDIDSGAPSAGSNHILPEERLGSGVNNSEQEPIQIAGDPKPSRGMYYKLINNKLQLYGNDFTGTSKYNIKGFPGEDGTNYYMLFEEEFYKLEPTGSKTPLEPIKDRAKINELQNRFSK